MEVDIILLQSTAVLEYVLHHVAGIVKRASMERMEQYMYYRIFAKDS